MTDAELVVCESAAAVVLHLRKLGPKGPCYSGGIDTPFLCGLRYLNGWDTRIPVKVFAKRDSELHLCRGCAIARASRV